MTKADRQATEGNPKIAGRTNELYLAQQQRLYRQTDRLFVVLMALQWIGGILMAMIISPRTWIGDTPYVHVHVWAAVVLGGIISSAPIVLGLRFPGTVSTRHVIAVAQTAWSALLIHLSGGRIETHFHVFGSLAFLAFYRDWKVLITATVVVAGDHFVRGVWWPESVYGVFIESPYRWIEHAAWVIFENIFLVISCVRNQREGRRICEKHAALERAHDEVEAQVKRRTRQLEEARARLEEEFNEHRKTQAEREQLHAELVDASHQAGMAEIAAGVLHNVGNVLNSVNVSTNLLADKLKANHGTHLLRACGLIDEHRDNVAEFFATDSRGKKLPAFLNCLGETIVRENEQVLTELASLQENVEHIKQVVRMQQAFATRCSLQEPVDLKKIVDDAVKINDLSLIRHEITIRRDYNDVPQMVTDKHKVVQILVNLIKNAKQAVSAAQKSERWIQLRIAQQDTETVVVEVSDNGIGIPSKNISNLFTHGFTTKKNGHGFGLHSGSLAAKELGGKLTAQSDGEGQGATFTLALPVGPPTAVANTTADTQNALELVT